MPERTSTLTSRLPAVGTTIFTVMSALAAECGAVNLGQGFPDFDWGSRLLGALNEGMRAGQGGEGRGDAANRGGGLPLLFFGLHKGPNLVCGIRNLHATMSGRA